MATKTKIPVTSENEDTERKMAVIKQRTGNFVFETGRGGMNNKRFRLVGEG